MFRNEWLRRARIKKFKQDAEIALFTMEVDDLGVDWQHINFDGRYSWEDNLTIAVDDHRPIYGFEIWHDEKVAYSQIFKVPIYLKSGDRLTLSLGDLEIDVPWT